MLDVIFILCLAVAFLIGYKTGFLRALVGFLGVVISALGGYLLYPYVTPLLMKTPLHGWIYSLVVNWLKDYLSRNENISRLQNFFAKYQADSADGLISAMASGITTVIFNIISVILILLVIKLLILILKKFTKLINHIPVIGIINRLCGMVLTGASFITVCYLVVAVMLLPPSNTTEISRRMCEEIDRSYVVRYVMDYNFFVNYESLSKGI